MSVVVDEASVPGPARVTLPCTDAASLRRIRLWLRDHLPTGLSEDARADAELVCTELATNTLDHADGPREVRIVVVPAVSSTDASVLIEARDGSPESVLLVGSSRLGEFRGRGMAIVDALSEWGVRREDGRKTVWARLTLR